MLQTCDMHWHASHKMLRSVGQPNKQEGHRSDRYNRPVTCDYCRHDDQNVTREATASLPKVSRGPCRTGPRPMLTPWSRIATPRGKTTDRHLSSIRSIADTENCLTTRGMGKSPIFPPHPNHRKTVLTFSSEITVTPHFTAHFVHHGAPIPRITVIGRE